MNRRSASAAARNAGWAHRAASLGPHVVTFHDAHMRFPEGVLEQLAVQAMRRRCIVSSASHGIPSKGTLAGCRMLYDAGYGLQPKWADGLPPGWQRTPCMMGAGYALSCRDRPRAGGAHGLACGRTPPAAGASASRRSASRPTCSASPC